MITYLVCFFLALFVWQIARSGKDNSASRKPGRRRDERENDPAPMPASFTIGVATTTQPTKAANPLIDPELENDAWESWATDMYEAGREKILIGPKLRIVFTDVAGKVTQRDVDVQRYTHNPKTGGGMMVAYCNLRHGRRPFRFSGISKAIDLSSGEVVSNLGGFLDAKYQQTPLYLVDCFVEAHSAALYVLFCIAKADGAMRAKERTLIQDFATRHGLTDPTAQQEFIEQLKNWVPDLRSRYYDAVKEAVTSGTGQPYLRDVLNVACMLVATDKKVHTDELRLLRYAGKTWYLELPKYQEQQE